MTLISPEMRTLVGRPMGVVRSYPITESDIRRWMIAVDHPDWPQFPDLAIDPPDPWLAPEDFNPFAWCTADPAGPPPRPEDGGDAYCEGRLGIKGPGLSHLLNGGIEVLYGSRLHVGDVVESTTTIGSYREHEGRLGPTLFTVLEHSWTTNGGRWVKLMRETLVRYA
jgi:hypothetical protein